MTVTISRLYDTYADAERAVRALEAAVRATAHWTAEGRQARTEAREHRAAAQQLKKRCTSAEGQRRTSEAALRQCRERGERWAGWAEEIRQELPDEVLGRAHPATAAGGSMQALRERWGQALRDWRDGISDTTLQQRLTLNDKDQEDLTIVKTLQYLKDKGTIADAQPAGGETTPPISNKSYLPPPPVKTGGHPSLPPQPPPSVVGSSQTARYQGWNLSGFGNTGVKLEDL